MKYKNQNGRMSYIQDQIYNSNIFDINNISYPGSVIINKYENG